MAINMFFFLKVSVMHASTLKIDNHAKINEVNYKDAQVWSIKFHSASEKELFQKLERYADITLWRESYKVADFLVLPEHKEKVRRQIRSLNLNYSINVNDVQNSVDRERAEMEMNVTYWTRYNTLLDVDNIIIRTAMEHPEIVTETVIGVTHEGRDIKLVRLSNGNPNNKVVLIEGTIHAREWISTATVIYIMKEFISNFSNESDDIRRIDWYFIPVMNPDGYDYTHVCGGDRLWRRNKKPVSILGMTLPKFCHGVDINRNFGYKWGKKYVSRMPCMETYGGKEEFSEKESTAIRDFITKLNVTMSAYVSFHSYGQMILYPPSDVIEDLFQKDELHALGKDMAEAIRKTSGYHYKVGSSSELLYPASGNSVDWVRSTGVKYTYAFELNDKGHHGFILPSKYIKPVGEAILAAVRVLAAKINEESSNLPKKIFF